MKLIDKILTGATIKYIFISSSQPSNLILFDRFVTALYPSHDDDVITSPYNCVLATRCLTEYADCVLPVENQALVDIVNKTTGD